MSKSIKVTEKNMDTYFQIFGNLTKRGEVVIHKFLALPKYKGTSSLGHWEFYEDIHSGRRIAKFIEYTGHTAILIDMLIFISDEKLDEFIANELQKQKEYDQRCHEVQEQAERAQYEKLKAKFEEVDKCKQK